MVLCLKHLKIVKKINPTQALAVTAKNESAQTGGTKNGWKNNWQMILQGPGSLPRGASCMGTKHGSYGLVLRFKRNRNFNSVYRNKYVITNDGEAKSTNGTNGAGWNNSYSGDVICRECNVLTQHMAQCSRYMEY